MNEAETLFVALRQSASDDVVEMLERMVRDAPDHALNKMNALDLAAAKQVHRWLNADVSSWLPAGTLCSARRLAALPCHFGQPVALGRTAALRVCIGARLVCQTALDDSLGSSLEARLEAQIQKARLAVRKVELIAHYYDALSAAGAVAPQARSA